MAILSIDFLIKLFVLSIFILETAPALDFHIGSPSPRSLFGPPFINFLGSDTSKAI